MIRRVIDGLKKYFDRKQREREERRKAGVVLFGEPRYTAENRISGRGLK